MPLVMVAIIRVIMILIFIGTGPFPWATTSRHCNSLDHHHHCCHFCQLSEYILYFGILCSIELQYFIVTCLQKSLAVLFGLYNQAWYLMGAEVVGKQLGDRSNAGHTWQINTPARTMLHISCHSYTPDHKYTNTK